MRHKLVYLDDIMVEVYLLEQTKGKYCVGAKKGNSKVQ